MRQFHRELIAALTQFADQLGEVQCSYEDVAKHMGQGITSDDVHQGLIHLNDDGYFPGDPMLTSDLFLVRLPDGGGEFRDRLVAVLRAREDKMGCVSATYEEIATALGDGATAGDVHHALIHLKDDGFFDGNPMLTSDVFECRMPEDD